MAPIRQRIVSGNLRVPVVFKGLISDWPASQWNVENLGDYLGEKLIKFRVGKRDPSDINLETDCQYRYCSIAQFREWVKNQCLANNPLSDFSHESHWCYADYKHMRDLFDDNLDVLKSIDWSVFGFEGRGGSESTLWIGSQGASTPCHFDTYGSNLVAQLHGRKRWIMFPPDDSDFMYQTRIPFEESSYFSRVNILRPDPVKYPLFKHATPYVVTLNPGDVLHVPSHWWHFVQCLEPSISVNTWIELESDHFERLKEAISRCLVFRTMMDTSGIAWLNPTETPTSDKENMILLNLAFDALTKFNATSSCGPSSHVSVPKPFTAEAKKRKSGGDADSSKRFKSGNCSPSSLVEKHEEPSEVDLFDIDPAVDDSFIKAGCMERVKALSIDELVDIIAQDEKLLSDGDDNLTNKQTVSDNLPSCSKYPSPKSPSKTANLPTSSECLVTVKNLARALLQPNVINLIAENLLQDVKCCDDDDDYYNISVNDYTDTDDDED